MGSLTVEVAPNVYRIRTMGDFVNTIVFREEDSSITLVDTGYKRAPARIVEGLAAIGGHLNDVQRIILTHAHSDHIGGAAELVRHAGLSGVAIHRDDVEFAESGVAPPLDVDSTAGRILTRFGRAKFDPVKASTVLSDGEELPVAGGLKILHTPGHSPGHISLLHATSDTLITGDAIWNMTSRMTWPVALFCSSHRLNQRTAHTLGEVDYEHVAFTHGPHINGRGREAIRGFLQRKGTIARN